MSTPVLMRAVQTRTTSLLMQDSVMGVLGDRGLIRWRVVYVIIDETIRFNLAWALSDPYDELSPGLQSTIKAQSLHTV